MNFNNRLTSILAGTAITSTLVVTQPLISMASLNGEELSTTTREITVLINRSDGQNGSGVIISKNDDVYYVLTANHVTSSIEDQNGKDIQYTVVTHDKEAYKIDYETVKPVYNSDLAVFEFRSDKEYPVATVANSELLRETIPVYVSGWQRPGAVGDGTKTIRQVTSSRITTILEEPVHGGYQIGYDNTTLGGMSGGPVVDAEGRLVGIHGIADVDNPDTVGLDESSIDGQAASELLKTGFNYGIPINTFLEQSVQTGIFLNLNVENTPSPELADAPIVATDPEKDEIDDLHAVLDDADRTIDGVDRAIDTVEDGVRTLDRVLPF